MKTKFKKVLSLILCVVLMLTLCAPALAVKDTDNDIPIVYLRGRGHELYDADGNLIYNSDENGEAILSSLKSNAKNIIKELEKAAITDNWDSYCDTLYDTIAPIYEKFKLNDDGEVTDGSHIDCERTVKKKTSNFGLWDYIFCYDWRLDPVQIGQELNDYIENILEVTGQTKVNIICRCYGSNVVASYLTEFGGDDVDHVIFYVPTADGTLSCGSVFAGKLYLNSQTINNFSAYYFDDDEDPLSQMLSALVTILKDMKTLDLAASTVNKIYQKVKDNVVPRLLLNTVGTMPSYWSMVGDEYYEDAKAFLFGDNTEQYAKLIEKIDNYHYNVQANLYDTLTELQNQGVKISNISKYNVNFYPVFENSDVQADGSVELSKMSFGATSNNITEKLSADYIAAAEENGTAKYISADSKVDASTCLFPDTTWFVRDCYHNDFPECVNNLIRTIFKSKSQMTVWDDENYPQYLAYDEEADTLTPITGADENDAKWDVSFWQSLVNFIKSFFKYIQNALFK